VIEFLKGFTYLRHLDMFNNPLSEEPYYRDRVIYGIPQLQIFDRRCTSFYTPLPCSHRLPGTRQCEKGLAEVQKLKKEEEEKETKDHQKGFQAL
jgi:hypothetical protein